MRNPLRSLLIGMLVVLSAMPAVSSSSNLSRITGTYEMANGCKFPGRADSLCNSARLEIGAHSQNHVRLTIESKHAVKRSDGTVFPYYCSFIGTAEIHEDVLVVRHDEDGELVEGLSLLLAKDRIKVVDLNAEKRIPNYCGQFATMDGLTFKRR